MFLLIRSALVSLSLPLLCLQLVVAAETVKSDGLTPREVILIPHVGTTPLDREMAALQKRVADAPEPAQLIQRLGNLFVAKARISSDPGFYKLAEQCAAAVLASHPEAPDALLLRGHVLGAMHRFREAEAVARQLVKQRSNFIDHALLGDVLMEQGRLDEAAEAYQDMIDLRPGLQSYCRVAHLRWLTGDLDGALEMMAQAVETGSSRDPEPMAWAYSRLALYQLEKGAFEAALGSANRALELLPEYPAALLARGRVLLAQGKFAEAAASLKLAAAQTRLPEYLWALADALRAAGEPAAAKEIETQIEQRAGVSDPRTLSIYLATRGKEAGKALELAKAELAEREDVHTHDALGWAHFAVGNLEQAAEHSEKAIAEGTHDPRLWLHSAMIAAAAGDSAKAGDHFQKAAARRQMLLPSEVSLLDEQMARLPNSLSTQHADL